MARIKSGAKPMVYQIKKWLGLNESPDGDTNLLPGEAAEMRNFRITPDGHLQIRPGTKEVANLMNTLGLGAAATTTTIKTEISESVATLALFPTYEVSDIGVVNLTGTSVTANIGTLPTYVGYYWKNDAGKVYQAGTCDYVEFDGDGDHVTGGRILVSDTISTDIAKVVIATLATGSPLYPSVKVVNGVVSCTGTSALRTAPDATYKYVQSYPQVYEVTTSRTVTESYTDINYVGGHPVPVTYTHYYRIWSGKLVTAEGNDEYDWNFYELVEDAPGSPIRGMWSGYVDGVNALYAACDGRLWKITETAGVLSKTNLGTITTSGAVNFFGYNDKLYIMNGSEYKVYDGETLSSVLGYIPITLTATTPGGAGTTLEPINMLIGSRKIHFSPDGATYVYALPEQNLTSVDHVQDRVTETDYTVTTDYTVDLTAGTVSFVTMTEYKSGNASTTVFSLTNNANIGFIVSVTVGGVAVTSYTYSKAAGTITFAVAPANGTNNIVITEARGPVAGTSTLEIQYTVNNSLRSQVVGKKFSEIYNGANDNRVFLYGDGTNKVIYSEIEQETGLVSAEYFPDLNVITIGDNSPVTGLARHHSVLMAFKGDAAFSIAYSSMTLTGGSVVAAFYVTPVNKAIGCGALGQAISVGNRIRTIDGQTIYEWATAPVTNDQRSATMISQKVSNTIKDIDASLAIMFYDKINHEFFISQGGTAIIQNADTGAWYVYTNFTATCFAVYNDQLYYGSSDGYIRHVSRDYKNDRGAAIDAYFRTGSIDFGKDWLRKNSGMLFVVLKPENKSQLSVTIMTDRKSLYATKVINHELATFAHANFARWSFKTNRLPKTTRLKIKAKKFTYYQLVFESNTNWSTATVLSADIKMRYGGDVR